MSDRHRRIAAQSLPISVRVEFLLAFAAFGFALAACSGEPPSTLTPSPAPRVVAVAPTSGSTSGGTSIVITGSAFAVGVLSLTLFRRWFLTVFPDNPTACGCWSSHSVGSVERLESGVGRRAGRRARLPHGLPPGRGRGPAGAGPLVLRESVEALGSLASGALSSPTARRVGQATSGKAAWRWSAVAIFAFVSAAASSV